MNKSRASCPASLSFIFKVCLPATLSLARRAGPNRDLVKMGSVGVGCTIADEVRVSVEKSDFDEIMFDGAAINFPTVHWVVKKLAGSPVRVSLRSSLPLGYGFGISSASVLGCAYALNKLFNLGKREIELAEIAHIAEIQNYTGLGSVATQITGGFLVKNKPGIPVDAYNLPFVGRKLYATIIDRLETPTVLHDNKRLVKINEAAEDALEQIKNTKNITLEETIDIAYRCVEHSRLIENREEENIIEKIRQSGGHATISMLGYVVLSTVKLDKITDYPVKELVISDKTVKYL